MPCALPGAPQTLLLPYDMPANRCSRQMPATEMASPISPSCSPMEDQMRRYTSYVGLVQPIKVTGSKRDLPGNWRVTSSLLKKYHFDSY